MQSFVNGVAVGERHPSLRWLWHKNNDDEDEEYDYDAHDDEEDSDDKRVALGRRLRLLKRNDFNFLFSVLRYVFQS